MPAILTAPDTAQDDPQLLEFAQWSADMNVSAHAQNADLPVVILPSDEVTISQCARQLFTVIAATKRLFARGGAVVHLVTRDKALALDVLRPAAARSTF